MNDANVARVRAVYETWLSGDVEGAGAMLDPDVEWVEPPEAPESETHRGPEGALFSTDRWTGAWEEYSFEIEELVPVGERVLVRARQSGRGKGSGILVEGPIFHVWSFRDGRAFRVEMFTTERPALSAAGLVP